MTTLVLKNISWTLTGLDLLKHFSKYGKVTKVVRCFDSDTGIPSTYGFVSFEDNNCAQKALNTKHQFFNREMRVSRAKNNKY